MQFRLSLFAAVVALAPAGAVSALAQTCACPTAPAEPGFSPVRILADEAPPPLPDYDQPPLPGPGYLWTPGYWSWNNEDYYWVPGVWVEPPRPGLLWTPGYWGFVNGVYAFNRGYWGPRVGFYGGVAYGFGYYGQGYEGGRWQGDKFFYNRTVNNITNVNITNVYERPAPRVTMRASFNGGPDGIKATPTPEELAAAKETHVPPTPAQRRNATLASRNGSSFLSVNSGKPPVAATAKPGEFSGAAVVPATAAGGPIPARPDNTQARPQSAPTQAAPTLKREAEPAPTPTPTAKATPAPTPREETPKPERREAAPKPELRQEAPKPERSDEAPKPERQEEAPKPERHDEKARPEPKREEPKREEPKRPESKRPEPKRPEPKRDERKEK